MPIRQIGRRVSGDAKASWLVDKALGLAGAISLLWTNSVYACAVYTPPNLNDVLKADAVVIARVKAFKKVNGRNRAILNLQIIRVVKGPAQGVRSVNWDNSLFQFPKNLRPGPYVIALFRASNAAKGVSAENSDFTILQRNCSGPFLFEEASGEARIVQQILLANRPR